MSYHVYWPRFRAQSFLQSRLQLIPKDALDKVTDMLVHLDRPLHHGPVRAILQHLELEAGGEVLVLVRGHPGRERGILVGHEQHGRHRELEVFFVLGQLDLVLAVERAGAVPVAGGVDAAAAARVLLHVEVRHLLAHERALSDVVDVGLNDPLVRREHRLPVGRLPPVCTVDEAAQPFG